MAGIQTDLIGEQLKRDSYFETSWEQLGIPYEHELAQQVIATSTEVLFRPPERPDREARAMSEACRAAAKSLMQPVVERLFPGDENERARRDWFLFGVNYYKTGQYFPPHNDLNDPDIVTIVILSLSGVRRLGVANKLLELRPRAITLLDGGANPKHHALCIEGPSVSVVADVPAFIY